MNMTPIIRNKMLIFFMSSRTVSLLMRNIHNEKRNNKMRCNEISVHVVKNCINTDPGNISSNSIQKMNLFSVAFAE